MSTLSTFDQVLERITNDRAFRAHLLEDTAAALASYDLSADDRDRLLQEAEMMEARVQEDPIEPTETRSP
ncbi:MAG: hypothetical protein ACRDJE_05330 [Dehalococcoidia bacterium]